MKKILLLFLVTSLTSLFAITKNEVYNFYKQKNYKETCYKGMWILNQYKKDDNYQSIVALSCVKSDMLNTAIRITKTMTHTAIGRHNASYIASLFLIKKLLLQVVYDNIDITNLSLPKSEHPLSILFENISHNNFSKVDKTWIVKVDEYKYILTPKKTDKVLIKVYKNNNLISTHIYW